MKILWATLLLALTMSFWTGCASIGPPQAPSLELPKSPNDLRAQRKADRVVLTWTVSSQTTDRQSVRNLGPTRVCRSVNAPLKECSAPLARMPAIDSTTLSAGPKRFSESFTDTIPAVPETETPSTYALYAVEVMNTSGRSSGISNVVRISLIHTVPPFAGFSATPEYGGIRIGWQCPNDAMDVDGVQYLFRIFRRLDSTKKEARIADIAATNCAAKIPLEKKSGTTNDVTDAFIDQTFEWESTYLYRGTVVSIADSPGMGHSEVEGADTPEVRVFAHDVFPPATPEFLQAVFSGPGQRPFVDLIWSPVTDADLAGYNVYRGESAGAREKLNLEPVASPAYRDTRVSAGKIYSYAVSAVDIRGNESSRSSEATETVP